MTLLCSLLSLALPSLSLPYGAARDACEGDRPDRTGYCQRWAYDARSRALPDGCETAPMPGPDAPRSPVARVWMSRGEGPSELCRKPQVFTGPDALRLADAWVQGQARTAPSSGGYDKVDFKVDWENGDSYAGRLDMKRSYGYLDRIEVQMVGYLMHIAEGEAKMFSPLCQRGAARTLLSCDFGDATPVRFAWKGQA